MKKMNAKKTMNVKVGKMICLSIMSVSLLGTGLVTGCQDQAKSDSKLSGSRSEESSNLDENRDLDYLSSVSSLSLQSEGSNSDEIIGGNLDIVVNREQSNVTYAWKLNFGEDQGDKDEGSIKVKRDYLDPIFFQKAAFGTWYDLLESGSSSKYAPRFIVTKVTTEEATILVSDPDHQRMAQVVLDISKVGVIAIKSINAVGQFVDLSKELTNILIKELELKFGTTEINYLTMSYSESF